MMRLNSRLTIGCAMLCAYWIATASAHHSHGNYTDTFIDLQGTVKEVHLLNPHSWAYMDVRNAGGQLQTWAIEATNKIGLERIGVTAETVKPGDTVKVGCNHLRAVSRGCLLGFLKTKDGDVKDWDGNRLPIPTDF